MVLLSPRPRGQRGTRAVPRNVGQTRAGPAPVSGAKWRDAAQAVVCIALVMASLLFGAFHLITWTCAIIAAFIGVYLGLLWIWTGNLLMSVITHAVYDFG